MTNKKTIIMTILSTLLIEIIIIWILWIIVYKDYKKITAAQSGIAKSSKYKEIKIQKVNISNIIKEDKDKKNKNNNYDWVLWKIVVTNKTQLNNKNNKLINYIYRKEIKINLSKINIKTYSALQVLNKNKLLDKYVYAKILKKCLVNINWKKQLNTNNLSVAINKLLKFASILWIINVSQTQKIQQEINNKITNNLLSISKEIYSHNITWLNKTLYRIENIKNITDNIYWKTDIIQNDKFQYIINKLLSDKYYKNIQEASRKTWIDKKLIVSAIAVEQLRYLNSNRAFAKKLLMQNKFLTNFSQFSYWLGGIKVDTFININKRLKKYEPYIYNKYFLYYDNLSKKSQDEIATLKEVWQRDETNKNIDYDNDKIIGLLKKHDVSTLYIAWLLLSIKDKRKNYWINISNKPWVILTLYNMWNIKTPHKNPWIGGSLIPIWNNKKKYFWEIWSIFYYYIDYYLNLWK